MTVRVNIASLLSLGPTDNAPTPPPTNGLDILPRVVNCNIFLCDDGDCLAGCRVVLGRDQVEVAADSGVVYGHVDDANGEDFEIDLTAAVTYYIWTTVGTQTGHIQDTSMTLFDADGSTVL